MRNDSWVGDWIPHHEVNPYLKTHADARDPFDPWPLACRDPAECGFVEWHFAPGQVTNPGTEPLPFTTARDMVEDTTEGEAAAPEPTHASAAFFATGRGLLRTRSPGLVLPGRDLDEPFRRRRRVDMAPAPQRPEEAGAMPYAELPPWPPLLETGSSADLPPPLPSPHGPSGPTAAP